MTADFQPGFSALLVAGALLFSAGLFAVLRRKRASNFLAGVLLMVSGINVDVLALARYVAGDRAGDVFSFLAVVAAASTAMVMFSLFAARRKKGGAAPEATADRRGAE